MQDGFSLKDSTIGIIGLGLMGASLALGLKGKCQRLIGYDTHQPTLEIALSKGIIDHTEDLSPSPSGSGARGSAPKGYEGKIEILILAVPVPSILNIIRQLPNIITQPCIVLDIGSTKRDIAQAMAALPNTFDPIGGHPICGRENLGIENADPELYKNAPFIVTPLERTTQKAKHMAQELIAAIGANPLEMSPEEHDRILAATSHLPFLISSALALATPEDVTPFIGPGFKSTSRLAGTSSSMMLGVLQSNRENVLDALHGMQNELAEIEAALSAEDFTNLETLLNEAQKKYHSFTGN